MKKKLLSIVLTLSLCLGLLPATALAAEDHICADEDGDYWCDVCWEIVAHPCVDGDGDYWCDICWEVIEHTCVDVADGTEDTADHFCALCGEHMSELCEDEDNDHACDVCWVIQEWRCIDEDNDHDCDNEHCANRISDCEDTEGDDNICDMCGKGIYPSAGELNVEENVVDGAITVTWSALEDVGTDRVASYTVYCYDAEGNMADADTETYLAANAPFTHTFTGLTNGVTYSVGVCASYTSQPDGEDSQFTATMEILASLSFADLWVGGIEVTEDNADDVLGDGTVSYEDGTLTLNGATIDAGYEYIDGCWVGIYATHNLNIVVEGINDITAPDAAVQSVGIYTEGDLSISGDGSMSCVGGSIGSQAAGQVASTGITVGGDFSVSKAKLTVEGGRISAKNCNARSIGVSSIGSIYIDFEGSLEATGGDVTGEKSYSCGVASYGGEDNYINIAVYDGYLKAAGGDVRGDYYAGSHGVFVQFGGLYTYSNHSSVIAAGGNAEVADSGAGDDSPYAFSNGVSVYGGDIGFDAGTVAITSGKWVGLDGDGWAVYVEGYANDDGSSSGGTVKVGSGEDTQEPATDGSAATSVSITAEDQKEGYAIYAQMGIEIDDMLTISSPEGGRLGSLGISDDETIMDSIMDADNNLAQNVIVKRIDSPFADVSVDAWYYDAVKNAYENGLMVGTSTTERLFSPEGITTRAQIVTILHRLEGSPVIGQGESGTFVDVPENRWYTEAVEWAAASNITSGTGDGTTFSPDDPITREQFAAFLYRYAQHKGYDVSVGEDTDILSYEDALNVSKYAIPAMQWACGEGVIGGMNSANGGMILDPQGNATRAQAAVMLMRFHSK